MLKICLMLQKKGTIIIDLKSQSENLCKNVHDVSLEDKSSVEDDQSDLSEIFKKDIQLTLGLSIESNNTIKVVQQNQVEEVEMIEIVLLIHIEDTKIMLEEYLIEK